MSVQNLLTRAWWIYTIVMIPAVFSTVGSAFDLLLAILAIGVMFMLPMIFRS